VNVIATRQLTRRYGGRTGIEAVNLDVAEGEIFGFLGPNGAGKTTTIRVLLGFLRASRGAAHILDLDCWRQSHLIKRRVGYLPGDLRLYPWFTARRALEIVGRVRGAEILAHGRELLERFRLEENLPVRKMSRGMRQKLGIVLSLVHKPQLLVLDEPTSGLDPLMCDELYGCLKELAAAGHTVFFSSHTLSEVELLCQRVAVVREGSIVADESISELRKRAHRAVTLRFRDAASASQIAWPEFLDEVVQDGPLWRCDLVGSASQLVEWAAALPLEDLSVGPPSLEGLFRRYYRTREESS
jgi:ABC-2 type transport system ATP-binding protein